VFAFDVAVAGSDSDELLVGTISGVLLSTDRGATWKRAGLLPHQVTAVAITPDGSTFHAGTFGGGVFEVPG
jgi:hypothetical protein